MKLRFRYPAPLSTLRMETAHARGLVERAAAACHVRADIRDVRQLRNGQVEIRVGLKLAPRGDIPKDDALPFQRRSTWKTRAGGDPGRVAAVCWHGHRDVFRALYAALPQDVTLRITTGLAVYRDAAHFEATFPDSDRNIGSQMRPCMASKACFCEGENHPYAEALRRAPVTMMRQSDMLTCPHAIMVFGHYRPGGSCRCNDPGHREMAEWGYTWDAEKGRWV
jgi:hypothetical protein